MSSHVTFLGPEGSFSHCTAKRLFSADAKLQACKNFNDVFQTALDHKAFAVVPLENNTAGAVDPALDLLIESSLSICAEYRLSVEHALVSSQQTQDNIDTLYAMIQPYYQCARFIQAQLPQAQWIQCNSSSESMAKCLEHGEGSAAIGFEETATSMGLQLLHRGIQDRNDNSTRFAVLSCGADYIGPLSTLPLRRSTFVFTLEDRPGTLLEVLNVFSSHALNMSHIESRPSKNPTWNYNFMITLESAGGNEAQLKQALHEVQDLTPWSRYLGTYPVLIDTP